MSDYYWELVEREGTVTKIPPDAVEVVKRRMEQGQPINLKTRSIPANQITSFHISEKPFSATPLIEQVAKAFNEPLINDEGEVQARWVKKLVPSNKWEKFYAPSGYKFLGEENGMVWVAFILPSHLIDATATPYCTSEEIAKLNG